MAALQLVDESHSTVINKALSNEESETVYIGVVQIVSVASIRFVQARSVGTRCQLSVRPLEEVRVACRCAGSSDTGSHVGTLCSNGCIPGRSKPLGTIDLVQEKAFAAQDKWLRPPCQVLTKEVTQWPKIQHLHRVSCETVLMEEQL